MPRTTETTDKPFERITAPSEVSQSAAAKNGQRLTAAARVKRLRRARAANHLDAISTISLCLAALCDGYWSLAWAVAFLAASALSAWLD